MKMTKGPGPSALLATVLTTLIFSTSVGFTSDPRDSSATAAAAGTVQPQSAVSGSPALAHNRFTQGLLWRIESPDGKSSHLFGTIHSSDPRVTRLPAAVKSAFDEASSFTMEILVSASGINVMAEAMFFADGSNLSTLLGEELYRRARQALIDSGLPILDLERKKPWVVIMLLNTPRAETGLPLDMRLQLDAVLQGKATYGLESMEEQIAVFNGMPLQEQVTLLRETLHYRAEVARQFEHLLRAYLARDLGKLMSIVENPKLTNNRAFVNMLERLLTGRNVIMLERMRPRLAEGNAFIAVGAAHLPGANGLLQLLENSGYRVVAVY